MRVLYLTNGFPFPLTSGYLRHYHLIRELSRKHEITLLSMVGPNFAPEHANAMAGFTREVRTFGSSRPSRARWRRGLTSLGALMPGAHGDPAIRALRDAVRDRLGQRQTDVILFSGKRTYPAIAGVRDVPVVADLCDATSLRLRGRMPHSSMLRRAALWAEYAKVRGTERRILRDAQHLLFASPRDREALGADGDPRATVVPNGVDTPFWTRQSDRLGRDTIVFTGAMDYAPNRDAATYLITEIFPLVRSKVAEARLLVVGRDAPPDLVRLGRRPGVQVTGLVPDVRPYLEQASVFVAPIRFGAGIQNKLLEAMAMAVPVIASPVAAEGLWAEGGDRPPVTVVASPTECADRIVERLGATRSDPTPDLVGRAFVERHFVWEQSAGKIDAIFASLAGQRP